MALTGLLPAGTLCANRGVEIAVAVYTPHGSVYTAATTAAVWGRAGVEARGMLLATYSTGGDLVLTERGGVPKLAAIATLRAGTIGEVFVESAAAVANIEELIP